MLEILSGSDKAVLKEEIIDPLNELDGIFLKFQQLVAQTIDLEATQYHEYVVKADFSPELIEIRGKKDAQLQIIWKEFDATASHLGLDVWKKTKLELNDTYGHFTRVSRLNTHLVRVLDDGGTGEIQELTTQKNGMYFTTPEMRCVSQRLGHLALEYTGKQRDIVREYAQSSQDLLNALQFPQ